MTEQAETPSAITTDRETASNIFEKFLDTPDEAEPEKVTKKSEEAEPEETTDDSTDSEEDNQEEEQETEETEESEETEEEPQEEPKYKVKIDGVEKELPVSELTKGYMLHSDYTRKTQQLSEKSKEIENTSGQITQVAQTYLQKLEVLGNVLSKPSVSQEEMQRLLVEDPHEYLIVQQREQKRLNDLALLDSEHQKTKQYLSQQDSQKLMQIQKEEAEKLTLKLPQIANSEWMGPKGKIYTYLMDCGFGPEGIKDIVDHRAYEIIYKAKKYDDLMAKKTVVEKKVQNVPKVTKKTSRNSKADMQQKAKSSDMETFKRTGDRNAGIRVFSNFI